MFLYNEILYKPLFNILMFFYNVIPGHDLGIAIIVLTVVIRLIFTPLSLKAQRSQKAMNALGPKIKEIKEKFKKDQVAQGSAIMQLYKENGVSPVAGCVPILIQLPILIALYQVFIAGLKPESLSMLYPFIQTPETINSSFLGLFNITTSNKFLALIAGGLQYLQSKQSAQMMSAGSAAPEMAALNKQMTYFFPILIVAIGWNLSAGLILYWVATTAYSIGEQ